jgi:class 3 adenylate cyclase/lipopolysaccharide biosynthesis regulator YciM
MKNLVLILSLFILVYNSYGQTSLDSLYAVWQDPTNPDSIRAKAYYDYVWDGFLYTDPDTASHMADRLIEFGEKRNYPRAQVWGLRFKGLSSYFGNDYPQALDYYQRSLNIAEKLGYLPEVARVLSDIGVIYTLQSDYPQALDCFTRGLKISEQLGKQSTVASFLSLTGSIYREKGIYPKALDYYIRCLSIFEQLGDQKGVATSLHNIGLIYDKQSDYPRALDYYQRSVTIKEQLSDQNGVAQSLLNIGGIYFEKGDYLKALDYYTRSLNISEQQDDQHILAKSLGNIGLIYGVQGDYPKALDYYTRSLMIHQKQDDQKGIAHLLTNIGSLYKSQSDYSKALDYCHRSYELALSIGVLDKQKDACQCLYTTYKAMGKGNQALIYLEKMQVVEDSLQSEETTKKLQQMEFQKEMLADSIAKAEEARLVHETHEEEMRQEQKTRNVSIGLGLLLLLVAIGLYTRVRYIRKSKAIIEKERNRSEGLLLNILPEEIARELKEKGRADARDFDMVSIVFTDFKSFTQQSAKLSAADLVDEINHCFEAFDGIMEKYGIEKIKTIGDAYMAAGGLPVPTDDSVKNTVLAALEMQAFIAKRKTENDATNKPAFEMRVGIHTGPVVAGIVGVKKFQYDVWGDTVNTANRMESSGAVGEVNISQATYELLKNDPDFAFESRGKVEAKGKGEMEMYFVSKA